MIEEINAFDTESTSFDEGNEPIQPVNDAEGSSEADTSNLGSAEDTAPDAPTDELAGEEGEGQKTVSEDESEEISDEERQKSEEEANKRLADPNSPKWFKNYVKNVYEPNLQKVSGELAAYEPLKSYGDVEKITENLEIVKGLEVFEPDPVTQQPVRTVRPFVERLVEKKGIETAVDVMLEICKLPSPDESGRLVADELLKGYYGLDPKHITDFKTFAANGYQTANTGEIDPDELALIPEHLREAYRSLSPAERNPITPFEEDTEEEKAARERFLKAVQTELDIERQKKTDEQAKVEQKREQKIKEQQEFNQDWDVRADKITNESGARLRTAFADSLVKDVGMERFDAVSTASLLSFALNDKGGDGEASRELLKEIGASLDPSIDTLYAEWQKTARDAAYFEKVENKTDYAVAVNHLAALEENLIRKAKPLVAAIAEYRANSEAKRIEQKNALLTTTQQGNNGIQVGEGQPSTVLGVQTAYQPEREVRAFD